jgi:hypothetical protein
MHLYFIARGTKNLTDFLVTRLQGINFPVKRINPKTKKLQTYYVPMNVKPLIPYELVFPEEWKDAVYNSLFDTGSGKPQHRKHDKVMWAMRKALGVKPISEHDIKKGKIAGLDHDHVEINAIGEKSDYWEDKDGKHYAEKPKDIETHEGL